MRKTFLIPVIGLFCCMNAAAQNVADTLRISDLFTTHIVFNTDLIYADLSNSQVMAAKILEQSKNIMALKARAPFTNPLSVSALESNGNMKTFIILFEKHPSKLLYDIRDGIEEEGAAPADNNTAKSGPGMFRKGNAPLLKDVALSPQRLYHLSTKQYRIEVTCTNILSYSDITYMVFRLKNGSGVSYECSDATFVVESKKKAKKSVVYDKNIFPKSRYGTISCAPGEETIIGYSMDKLSLSKNQILMVYFYEQGGQRELVLSIDSEDINKAKNTL